MADLSKYKKATTTQSVMPQKSGVDLSKYKKTTEQPQEKQGFLKNLVMSTGIPRFAANVAKLPQAVANVGRAVVGAETKPLDTAQAVNMPWLGAVKPVGQEGTIGQKLRDIGGESLKLASTVVPVGRGVASVGKATLGGKIIQGATTGFKNSLLAGGLYGAGEELQQEDATIGSVLKEAGKTSILSGIGGGFIGGVLPLTSKTVQTAYRTATQKGRQEIAEETMNRVARVNPTDYNKFKKTTGMDVGKYLVKRGIYGNDEEIAKQLFEDSMRSKNIVDEQFAKMGGTWKDKAVKDALDILAEREARVSSPNIKSQDFDLVQQLIQKHNTEGLTMSEINTAKRLFERNAKMDFLKANVPDKVAQANNIDNAIRKFQFSTAEKLGLKNLAELNKNTQASYMLSNALYKKITGQSGNNAIGLGDLVLLSGGDVRNVAMAGARKFFGSKSIQSKFAQKIAPTKGTQVMPQTRTPITQPSQMLPEPSFIPMSGQTLQDTSMVQAVPAQRNLVTTNPQTGRFQRTYNSMPIQGSAMTTQPQTQRIKPLLVQTLSKEKLPSKSVVMPSSLKNQSVSSSKSILQKGADWYKKNLGDESGMIKNPFASGAGKAYKENIAKREAELYVLQQNYPLGGATQRQINTAKKNLQSAKDAYKKYTQVGSINVGAMVEDLGGKKTTDNLIEEAKKYKSAEEFVRAQGTPVYHGTNVKFDKFDKTKIGEATGVGDWGEGFYFSDSKDVAKSFANDVGGDIVMEIVLPKNLKFADGNKLEKLPEIQNILDDDMGFTDIGEYLKNKGYDGLKYKHSEGGGIEYVVYDADKIKTSSQLTNIWNKAHNK